MLALLIRLLRYLLATACAALLLISLSYPDAILPPLPPDAAPAGEFSPAALLRDYLYIPPLLLLLIASAGSGFSKRLLSALLTVLLVGFLSWPVLRSLRPELIEPTFSYQSGMLPKGLALLLLITLISLPLCALLHYFSPPPPEPENELNTADMSELAPEKGRTVQEIIANPVIVRPRFLFGDPDMALVERFRCFVRAVARRRALRYAVLGLLAIPALLWFFCYPQPDAASAFERDLELMRDTRSLPDGRLVATTAAVHAGYRVMKQVQDLGLIDGLSPEQARQRLHLDTLPEPYRSQVLDSRPLALASMDAQASNRTRFLTLTDGRRIAVLYLLLNEDGTAINIAEVRDAGWDAAADAERKRARTRYIIK